MAIITMMTFDLSLLNISDFSIFSWDIWNEQLPAMGTFIAQALSQDYDIFADAQEAFNNFVESGQVWALGIGLVAGYMFRAFTTY